VELESGAKIAAHVRFLGAIYSYTGGERLSSGTRPVWVFQSVVVSYFCIWLLWCL